MNAKSIDIREEGFLWKLYCKGFLIEGKEIENPKNLCQYVQGVMRGFSLWMKEEVSLCRVWIVFLLSTTILVLVAEFSHGRSGIFIDIMALVSIVSWVLILWVTIITTWSKFWILVTKRFSWVVSGVEIARILFVIGVIIWLEFFAPDSGSTEELIAYEKYIVGGAIVFGIALILPEIIPKRYLRKVGEALLGVIMFLIAKKRKICPLVNPPKSFQEK